MLANTFKSNGQLVPLTGGVSQLFHQLQGVLFTVIFAALMTWILLKLADKAIGLRVDEDAESLGLDLSQHGEKAYNQ